MTFLFNHKINSKYDFVYKTGQKYKFTNYGSHVGLKCVKIIPVYYVKRTVLYYITLTMTHRKLDLRKLFLETVSFCSNCA